MRVAVKIVLTDGERATLVKWSRGRSTPARLVQRAKIVLAAADGRQNQEIATELGCARKTVGEWRNRFAADRLAGIEKDAPRAGRRPTQRERFEAAIIRQTTQETPPNATQWSTRTLAKAMGCDDMLVQRVASTTGLRANELANLTPESFDLTANPPTITIQAKTEKSRRGAVLPLLAKVAERLDQWMSSRPIRRSARLWPGTWSEKAAVMFRKDLQATRDHWIGEAEQNPTEHARRLQSDFLKPATANGERADFHALRHSFVSMLASSGVHPKTAQMLARHSTITLTMDRYSHVRLADLSQAVQGLPSLLTTPESGAVIHVTGTQPPVPCCLPCCPADDFSCNALTTIDDSSPTAVTATGVRNSGDSLSSDAISLSFIAQTEMNRGKPSSEIVSI